MSWRLQTGFMHFSIFCLHLARLKQGRLVMSNLTLNSLSQIQLSSNKVGRLPGCRPTRTACSEKIRYRIYSRSSYLKVSVTPTESVQTFRPLPFSLTWWWPSGARRATTGFHRLSISIPDLSRCTSTSGFGSRTAAASCSSSSPHRPGRTRSSAPGGPPTACCSSSASTPRTWTRRTSPCTCAPSPSTAWSTRARFAASRAWTCATRWRRSWRP
mmetsp:Transcript_40842/g.109318  ORF Transcript_40842/g.109318 Transcript_40842/m.109318 type:complete len:214 (+) Transcript_40842:299-940(+)